VKEIELECCDCFVYALVLAVSLVG
jgi:hypothetical protein